MVASSTGAELERDQQASDRFARLKRFGPPAVAALVFGLTLFAVDHLLAHLNYHVIMADLRTMPLASLAWAILFTLGSFACLTGYDWSAISYIGKSIPYRRIAFGSFAGYAISNTIGFSLLSGPSVRYRIYASAGLEALDVARVALVSGLAFHLGISAVAGVALVLRPDAMAGLVSVPAPVLAMVGAAMLVAIAALIAFVAWRRHPLRIWRWTLDLPSGPLVIGQLCLSVVEIACAGSVLYVLLPGNDVTWLPFITLYCLAIVAGVISHVPGGFGVFESVMLFLLADRMPAESVTAGLVAYRAIYNLLPLLVAAGLLAGDELLRQISLALETARRIGGWSTRLGPAVMGTVAFVAGVVLIASSATPAVPKRMNFLSEFVPLSVVEAAHFLSAVAGFLLLILSRGLFRRLNGAYWLAMFILPLAALTSLAKGWDFEEASLMTIALLVLVPCRREFYRKTSLLDAPFTTGWVLAIGAVVAGMAWLVTFSYKHVDYAHHLWWQFAFEQDAPRSLRALLAVFFVAALAGLARLLHPPRHTPDPPEPEALTRAGAIVAAQDRTYANLALYGDKSLLFSESGNAFIMYGVRGRSWIAMGDPVGRREEWADLAWTFREDADRLGARIAFYQASPEALPLYLDLGLVPIKIGEEAVVDLILFSLQGRAHREDRNILSRGERDGLDVEILHAAAAEPLMSELRAISDDWLATKNVREKRFALGAFSPPYLEAAPLAIARLHGRPVAFASLMTTETMAEVSIDLMRYARGAPRYTMHYLFLRLMVELKATGYRSFTLGLAPMSGLEGHPLGPFWHKVGNFLFQHGEHFYNFQGLRGFKNKFEPTWQPRYLAAPGGLSPLIVMTDVAALVGGGLKGVISR